MPHDLSTVPIIDTHQHLWDLSKLTLAWLRDAPYSKLARDFLPADYATATAGFNVVKTVYMEVDVPPSEHAVEADLILQLCGAPGSPLAGAVLGGRPGDDQFAAWVDRFRQHPHVKGFREVLFDKPADYFLRDSFIRGVRRLGDMGFTFDVEAPAASLPHTLQLFDSCPSTVFILDHCAHPDLAAWEDTSWKANIARCAERDNVVMKLSGAFSVPAPPLPPGEALAKAVDYLLDTFGPDRIVFGSDWPVVTLAASFRAWADAVWAIVGDRNQTLIRKLFHDNAVRVYRLA